LEQLKHSASIRTMVIVGSCFYHVIMFCIDIVDARIRNNSQ